MKKLITLLVLIFLLLSPQPTSLLAKALPLEYARTVESCPLYADESCRIVKFYIPKGFCVRAVSVGSDVARVVVMEGYAACPVTEGYVKNINLFFLEERPDTVYPLVELTLKREEVIFGSPDLTLPKAVLGAGERAYFYGTVTANGTEYLYVYAGGQVGYVNKGGFDAFTLPDLDPKVEADTSESFLDDQSAATPPNGNGDDKSVTNGQILVIAVVLICGLCVFYLILRPDRTLLKDKSGGDFED